MNVVYVDIRTSMLKGRQFAQELYCSIEQSTNTQFACEYRQSTRTCLHTSAYIHGKLPLLYFRIDIC